MPDDDMTDETALHTHPMPGPEDEPWELYAKVGALTQSNSIAQFRAANAVDHLRESMSAQHAAMLEELRALRASIDAGQAAAVNWREALHRCGAGWMEVMRMLFSTKSGLALCVGVLVLALAWAGYDVTIADWLTARRAPAP